MSYTKRLVVLALFGLLFALVPAAHAQCLPVAPIAPAAAGLVPFGNTGNGITDVTTWTTGSGSAVNTNGFVDNFVGPTAIQGTGLGFPLFDGWGCGPCGFGGLGACGFPSNFASFGPFQTGVGNNVGTQQSAATGFSDAESFGLQPIGLAFGVPVPCPAGLLFT